MKKYTLLFLAIFNIFFTQIAHWVCENPEYTEYWEDCIQKNNAWQPHVSTDYLCISSENDEAILYSIILDQEFREVDDDIYIFLEWLEESKSYFFWIDSNASYFQWVDIIGSKFWRHWEYWSRYDKICNAGWEKSINTQVLQCLGAEDADEPSLATVTTDNAVDYLSDSSCMSLAVKKLWIYEKVGYDILKINKAYIRKDNRKTFMQWQRTRYNNLLEWMRINVGYLERIWKKWTSKTKNVY